MQLQLTQSDWYSIEAALISHAERLEDREINACSAIVAANVFGLGEVPLLERSGIGEGQK